MTPIITIRVIALGGVIATAALTIGQGLAQTTYESRPGFSGATPSSVAGCPYIVWRLARDRNGHVHGIAYYSDLTGTSSVTGKRDANGHFTLDVEPTNIGAGPSGKVTGVSTNNGQIEGQMVGQGCANVTKMIFRPMDDLNTFPGGG
jgi:hypothetical protein